MLDNENNEGGNLSPSNKKQAYLYAIKLLTKRDYSEFKITYKLKEKKYSKQDIIYAIEKIKLNGFLNENYYAESRIKGMIQKGYSASYVIQKLSQEKISVDLSLVENIFAEYKLNTYGQITLLIVKKLRSIKSDDPKKKEKLLRFLLSKGHSYSCCSATIDRFIKTSEDS